MNPFYYLSEYTLTAVDLFLTAATFCYNHWPLEPIGQAFYNLSVWCTNLRGEFLSLKDWWDFVTNKIGNYLSWDYIKAKITEWLPLIGDAITWFGAWWNNVRSNITNWWSAVSLEVGNWIQISTKTVQDQIDRFTSLDIWRAWWGDNTTSFIDWWAAWWGSKAISFWDWWKLAVAAIENSINVNVNPLRDVVNSHTLAFAGMVDFFRNPVKFIWDRFLDWFLGDE